MFTLIMSLVAVVMTLLAGFVIVCCIAIHTGDMTVYIGIVGDAMDALGFVKLARDCDLYVALHTED